MPKAKPDKKIQWRFRSPPSKADGFTARHAEVVAEVLAEEQLRDTLLATPVTAPHCRAANCANAIVFGTTLCAVHGAPLAKERAETQLRAMVGPIVKRLETLAHQNDSLPTALNACNSILSRVGLGDKDKDDKRPQIRIAIAVGGIPLPQTPAALPAPEDDVVITPQMEKAMRDDDD